MSQGRNDERIERALRVLDQRLTELERILSQGQGRDIIIEENRVPERVGRLGGRTFSTNGTGGIEKEIRIPVCDVCGRALSDKFFVCHNCGGKLCGRCVIDFSGATLCLSCLKEELPLNKRNFKVLAAVANGLESLSALSELIQIKREEAERALQQLQDLGLTRQKGLAIFTRTYTTDKGLEAIAAYSQIYGRERDVVQFDFELRDYISEKVR